MPGYRVHVGGGILFYIAGLFFISTYFIFHPPILLALEWFFCTILGSLFPDIDTKSKGQLIFYKAIALCLFYLLWKRKIAAFIWLSLLAMVPQIVHHRGLFHKVWFVIALPFISALLFAKWFAVPQKLLLLDAFFFSIGALSHIFFDRSQTRLKKLRI